MKRFFSLLLCAYCACVLHAQTITTWTAETSGTTDFLRGVWATDANNAWAVGFFGTTLRKTGGVWTTKSSGTTNSLMAVWGVDNANVWAVGANGTILKWNGSTWIAQVSNTTQLLYGVWGTDINNIWAVGAGGTILKWNGVSWTTKASGTTLDLYTVWGIDGNTIWAGGRDGVLLQFNGTSWATQSSGTTSYLRGFYGSSSSDVWAVGLSGVLLRYNGATWTPQTIGTTNHLYSIWGRSATEIWAVGANSTILRYDGSTWTPETSSIATAHSKMALWGDNTNNLITVGQSGTIETGVTPPVTLQTGLVAHYPFNGNANDESNNGNNGTVNGATLTTDRFGNANSAYSFGGINNYIDVNNFTINYFSNDYTISVWTKFNNFLPTDYPQIIHGQNNFISFYGMGSVYGSNQGKVGYYHDQGPGGTLTTSTNTTLTLNTYYHFVAVRKNGLVILYMDGVAIDAAYSPLNGFSGNGIRFGQYFPGFGSANQGWLDGDIDDIRIYDRALSAAEVQQLYNEPNPTPPVTPGVTVLVHGFQLGGGYPDEFIEIAESIRNHANLSGKNSQIYKNDPTTGVWQRRDGSQWVTTPASGTIDGEIILLYDWAQISNNGVITFGSDASIEAAADNLFALLTSANGSGSLLYANTTTLPFLLAKPVHVIAHSRGTILSLQVFHRLLKYFPAAQIEQFTLLDPHPASATSDVGINSETESLPGVYGLPNTCGSTGCADAGTVSLKIPTNVQHVDNYYRMDGTYELLLSSSSLTENSFGSFDGVPVQGLNTATNCTGTADFNRQLIEDVIDDVSGLATLAGGSHSAVHFWYRGTIDPAIITPITWYTMNGILTNEAACPAIIHSGTNARNTGYYYSRIGGHLSDIPLTPIAAQVRESQMDTRLTTRRLNSKGNAIGLEYIFNGNFDYDNAGWKWNGGGLLSPTITSSGLPSNAAELSILDAITHSYMLFPKDTTSGNTLSVLTFSLYQPPMSGITPSTKMTVSFLGLDGAVLSKEDIALQTNTIWRNVAVPVPATLTGQMGTFRVEVNGGSVYVDNFDLRSCSLITPTVSIVKPSTPICASTPITLTVQTTNQGTAPGYQWRINGWIVGSGTSLKIPKPSNNAVITVSMASNATCATSSLVSGSTTLVFSTVTPQIGITSPSSNTVCAGKNVTFTAQAINRGTAPKYQWKINGANAGTNSPTFTTNLLKNNQTVTVELTSNATCVSTTKPVMSLGRKIKVVPCSAAPDSTTTVENQFTEALFSLYPNPTEGIVYITVTDDITQTLSCRVIDVLGRVLLADSYPVVEKRIALNMGTLATGFYTVQVLSETGWVSFKVEKQ